MYRPWEKLIIAQHDDVNEQLLVKAPVEPSNRESGTKSKTRVLSATGHQLADVKDGTL